MDYKVLAILIAYLLDLIFGDPQWAWHPVRIIGRLIDKLETRLNTDKFNRKFSGTVLVILIVGFTVFCVWAILVLAKFIHPVFYYFISVLFIYFSLSLKSLDIEASKVYKALRNGNIKEARKNLSMIVARDTDRLDEPEIIRATVETVAESTMDGIVAPLFYAFLGGPVLAWGYKAINTLDSMVGYMSERFMEFGKLSARLDAVANFIPAKITCFLITVSSWVYRKDGFRSLKWAGKHFLKGPEFNSQATEAAMAGALGIRLGGTNSYNSVSIDKPLIGDDFQPLAIKHIRESIRITHISSMLMLMLGMISHILLRIY